MVAVIGAVIICVTVALIEGGELSTESRARLRCMRDEI